MKTKVMKIAARMIVALFIIFSAVILCEVVLRVFLPGDSPLFLDIYAIDEYGLLTMKPDIKRRHVTGEWDVTYEINTEGLRDRNLPVDDGEGRVLAVGDSFAFGWGVNLEETYLYLTEEDLKPQNVRIIKAGIPGTGTSDQLEWLEKYGKKYKPQVVLVSFFVGNDFTDVQMGGIRNQFVVKDGLMVRKEIEGSKESSAKRIKDWVKRSSLLAQRVAMAAWAYERSKPANTGKENPALDHKDSWLFEYVKVHLKKTLPETEEAFTQTLKALDGMMEWCAANQARLVLLVIPRSIQVYDEELQKWMAAYGIKEKELDLDKPQRVLWRWAEGKDIVVCDLIQEFRKFNASHLAERLFFYPNGHMNAIGNKVVADVLKDILK